MSEHTLYFDEYIEDDITYNIDFDEVLKAAERVTDIMGLILHYCTEDNVEEIFKLIQKKEILRAFDVFSVGRFNALYGTGKFDKFQRGFRIDPNKHSFVVDYGYLLTTPMERMYFTTKVLDES